MRRWHPFLAAWLLSLLAGAPAGATPLDFDMGDFTPPAALDTSKPHSCTITYLVVNDATNEVFATRMLLAPPPGAVAEHGDIPCPLVVSPRVGQAALDGCREHADRKADCVFADMSRGFETEPLVSNTSENASRCASDQAPEIAIACWSTGKLDVCSTACGASRDAAITAARNRCEAKHRKLCRVTGVLPVEEP